MFRVWKLGRRRVEKPYSFPHVSLVLLRKFMQLYAVLLIVFLL